MKRQIHYSIKSLNTVHCSKHYIQNTAAASNKLQCSSKGNHAEFQ